jgi:hypothetical protein
MGAGLVNPNSWPQEICGPTDNGSGSEFWTFSFGEEWEGVQKSTVATVCDKLQQFLSVAAICDKLQRSATT